MARLGQKHTLTREEKESLPMTLAQLREVTGLFRDIRIQMEITEDKLTRASEDYRDIDEGIRRMNLILDMESFPNIPEWLAAMEAKKGGSNPHPTRERTQHTLTSFN